VIEQADNKNQRRMWVAQCECGALTTLSTNTLTSGNTRSCGCLFREMAKERKRLFGEARLTHGMTKTPEWSSWRGMVLRCTVPVTHSFEYYGGAEPPVKVDPDWLGAGGFERFFEHLGERPDGTTLGRLGDEGDYVPGNVKWMTREEQLATRRAKRELQANEGARQTHSSVVVRDHCRASRGDSRQQCLETA
jgi:hypothetical protein